jgi:large subunit ribosomal protein L3
MNAIIGEKLGMTQIFDQESAKAIPVTVVKAGPCRVVQVKTPERDGYSAVQLGYAEMKPTKANQPTLGHFAKADLAPHRHLVEVRVDDATQYEPGQEVTIADVLAKGQKADVTGVSKGKGFQGVMKRHNFSGQGASHGAHRVHRAPGSIGACATPARVFKGMKMAGRMGGETVTVQNLTVIEIDVERGLVLLGGAVPGPKGSVVLVKEAVKAHG